VVRKTGCSAAVRNLFQLEPTAKVAIDRVTFATREGRW